MKKISALALVIMTGIFLSACGCTDSDTTNVDVNSTQTETKNNSPNVTASEETSSPNTETESEDQTQIDSAPKKIEQLFKDKITKSKYTTTKREKLGL